MVRKMKSPCDRKYEPPIHIHTYMKSLLLLNNLCCLYCYTCVKDNMQITRGIPIRARVTLLLTNTERYCITDNNIKNM